MQPSLALFLVCNTWQGHGVHWEVFCYSSMQCQKVAVRKTRAITAMCLEGFCCATSTTFGSGHPKKTRSAWLNEANNSPSDLLAMLVLCTKIMPCFVAAFEDFSIAICVRPEFARIGLASGTEDFKDQQLNNRIALITISLHVDRFSNLF